MGGGAGRGKFKGGPTGRRTFSRPDEMAEGGPTVPKWKRRNAEAEEEESEEEEEEEEGGDEQEKQKGVAGIIQTENPNAPRKAAVKVTQASTSDQPTELSRREREELQKQASRERYMKLQEQGKTEQAQKDLERLSLIRRQREEAAKKREEERLAKEAKKTESRR